MRRIFRRKPSILPPRMDPFEARVASAWGFRSEAAWYALTDQRRAYYRTNLTKAPRYTA